MRIVTAVIKRVCPRYTAVTLYDTPANCRISFITVTVLMRSPSSGIMATVESVMITYSCSLCVASLFLSQLYNRRRADVSRRWISLDTHPKKWRFPFNSSSDNTSVLLGHVIYYSQPTRNEAAPRCRDRDRLAV